MKRISVEHISKTFVVNRKKNENILSYILSALFVKEATQLMQVLTDISFEVEAGEIIGIIGYNGSGKSTLLRTIAGIYTANKGSIQTQGKMMYISGFGQGLKDRLTMRDNIFLIGSLMGLGRNDITDRFQTIVEFSGLEEYIDTKVYQFSSGMQTRLTFSIAIHCVSHHNPDILLIDEVLSAGGDINFQEQAGEKIEELIKGGAAVLMVSHNLDEILKYCSKVIWLEKGNMKMQGATEQIVEHYKNNKSS